MISLQPWAGARVHLTEVDPGTGALCGNVGLHVGDDEETVRTRRAALAAALGRSVVWMNQTHSTTVETILPGESGPVLASGARLDRDGAGQWGPVDCDGIVIDARGWSRAPCLAVQTADCLPVVFSADAGGVVAAVHAGRRGLLGGILARAVDAIRARTRGPIRALIGPAICGGCYEVPEDLAEASDLRMPGIRALTSWGTPSLDLPGAAARFLTARGVEVTRDGRCTLEELDLFSYRANPACGRQALVIAAASPANDQSLWSSHA